MGFNHQQMDDIINGLMDCQWDFVGFESMNWFLMGFNYHFMGFDGDISHGIVR